eukprot:GHRR01026438.1.p1 GENE.GHRR01026438.1~~GHRR01026438.1.p1  ORF type:complete len:111 (-),score=1.17 GHRR01026438.1:291-623(-)
MALPCSKCISVRMGMPRHTLHVLLKSVPFAACTWCCLLQTYVRLIVFCNCLECVAAAKGTCLMLNNQLGASMRMTAILTPRHKLDGDLISSFYTPCKVYRAFYAFTDELV